ncbi:MAG: HAD family hydrolase [Lachnospiraceae bacterium]|nr:HAD family hydrolase [Lachnospiraceae bacterium]
MKKAHLLFDLDGTLTDSMPGITRAVQYALRHYGIEVEDLNVLKPFVGPPLQDSFKEYYNFSEKDASDAVLVFREYYNDKGWLQNEPYEGIEHMLKTLKDNGKKLYVATSKPEWMAKRVLDHFQLSDYFEYIGGADDAENREKKDDVIRYVMASCGLEEKESIVMVGDRRHDIEGAHKTGLPAVGVLYGYGDREELEKAGAEWIKETTATLLDLLLKL